MQRWTKDVSRWIRPHHIIESVKNPKRVLRELKYRHTFTSKERFIIDILSFPQSQVLEVFDEVHRSDFFFDLDSEAKKHPPRSGRGAMGDEAELLYVCFRLTKPALVVETGVGAGLSTAYILKALERNDHGELYSIDFYEDDEQCGWIIPHYLKKWWKLTKGLSSQVLNPLLSELGPIDAFIHDSDHSYENMMMEFRAVWPYLKNGGVFMAHDVGRNDALFDFLKELQFSWRSVRTYKVLAGFQKIWG